MDREAENALSRIEGLRSIFIRPGTSLDERVNIGLMYSNTDRPHLQPVKDIISGIAGINSRSGGKLSFLGGLGVQPLNVETVARATIAATLDPSIQGIIDVESLTRLRT
jgi:hypothetical protein